MPTRPGYIWSGTEWVSIGQEAVVAPVSYQTSAPSSPSTGDIWIDSNDDVPGIDTSQFLRWRKTAVGGETSVSGTDDNGLTLQYTANYEQVYLNGVLLVRGQDYTATNGTSITGLTALAANDVVEVFGVVARVVGDVYTQAQTNSLLDAKSNVSTTGLVLISSTTFTGVSNVQLNNVFSSSYRDYKVITSITSVGSNGILLNFRMSSSGTPVSTSTYAYQRFSAQGTGVSAERGTSLTQSSFGYAGSGGGNFYNTDFYGPFLASATETVSTNCYSDGSFPYFVELMNGYHSTASSYDGINVFAASGNITGSIKVYGYK